MNLISISTPDHVELKFEAAGPVSRFAALVIDFCIIFLMFVILLLAAVSAGLWSTVAGLGNGSTAWVASLMILLGFCLNWGYYLGFETVWRGRTPGKSVMGLRVIRDDGLPVGLREASTRNLVRAADMMFFYFVGGLVALLESKGRRLGDLAAGTIVVRERFAGAATWDDLRAGAGMAVRLEAGRSRQAVVLPQGHVDARSLSVIRQFMERRLKLPPAKRDELAWKLASPYLEMMGRESDSVRDSSDRRDHCEEALREILDRADGPPPAAASSQDVARPIDEKALLWSRLGMRIERLLKGGRAALRRLAPDEIERLISNYRRVTADLARTRSLGSDWRTEEGLNRLAVAGHNLLYGYLRPPADPSSGSWWASFPRAVRGHWGSATLAGLLLLLPALIAYTAVIRHPGLGYDIVSEGFLDFEPARDENLHDIPPLSRPVVASRIIANNLQVALAAFGLGLTAGLGTSLLLIFNGVQVGAVAGWLALNGNTRAFWGWIMPHGGTELMAIALSGAAGFVLAEAILSPGRLRRAEALKKAAPTALIIELGALGMLLVAGIIEGFISPSSLAYGLRIVVLLVSVICWASFLLLAGRAREAVQT